jgi:hypothetical protein
VTTLIEQGEHGYLAARISAQVIKAFVEKKRRTQLKTAQVEKPAREIEVGALWSATSDGADGLHGGRFKVALDSSAKRKTTERVVAGPALALPSAGGAN